MHLRRRCNLGAVVIADEHGLLDNERRDRDRFSVGVAHAARACQCANDGLVRGEAIGEGLGDHGTTTSTGWAHMATLLARCRENPS